MKFDDQGLRHKIELTDAERQLFRKLPPLPGAAFRFWHTVAGARGLDSETILTDDRGVSTALPLGHKKHWCWPIPLKCMRKPPG